MALAEGRKVRVETRLKRLAGAETGLRELMDSGELNKTKQKAFEGLISEYHEERDRLRAELVAADENDLLAKLDKAEK